jgi:catechol 2,3-dioxygenase-like lactoylglutathione lyase family enzyme
MKWKPLAVALCACLAVCGWLHPASAEAPAIAVGDVGMTVSDMDRAVAFYTTVLDFQKISDDEVTGPALETLEGVFGAHVRVVRLRLGGETIALTSYLTPGGRPIPVDSASNDRWFQHIAIIVSDMDRAYARLRAAHVGYASTEPQQLPKTIPGAAGITAFYFRDPDNHIIEVLHFPPDKGDPKWHGPHENVFLGIDHSAIVVADTKASLHFYVDEFGFRIAGTSDNFGLEQEHLNNVEGARLHITTLRASSGPGIELLEYVNPRTGRPYPADERSNDIVHWQTQLVVPDADARLAAAQTGHRTIVSRALVRDAPATLGFQRGFLVRDPDGHVMEVLTR